MELKKDMENPSRAHFWHSDVTVEQVPPSFSLLYGKRPLEIEEDETWFCNIHTAYESLSPGLKAFLGARRSVHTGIEYLNGYNNDPGRSLLDPRGIAYADRAEPDRTSVSLSGLPSYAATKYPAPASAAARAHSAVCAHVRASRSPAAAGTAALHA